jgi:hypothetical protein
VVGDAACLALPDGDGHCAACQPASCEHVALAVASPSVLSWHPGAGVRRLHGLCRLSRRSGHLGRRAVSRPAAERATGVERSGRHCPRPA